MAGFGRVGTPSATVRLRAMANDPDGEALLSELKAVDGAYPLYGTMRLESGARQGPPSSGAIWIGKDLATRLDLKVGERVKFGEKRSEEHTSELQSLMRISYAVFCLKTNHNTLLDTHYQHISRHTV